MILITGDSGSGKTGALYALEEIGYNVIPTYTTRQPRPKDKGTICISETEFQGMIMKNMFVSFHTFNSKMGKLSYGISLVDHEDILENSAVIIVKEYYNDIIHHLRRRSLDVPYIVYIDVDEDSIIEKAGNSPNRGSSVIDLPSRLKRDREKNDYLKSIANLVVDNRNFKLGKYDVANIISTGYKSFLYGKGD